MQIRSFINRVGRAAKLDTDLYREVKSDSKASMQAFLVVVLVSLAIGFGIGLAGWFALAGAWSIWGILAVLVGSVIVWLFWSLLIYFVGTRLFRRPETSASISALLRTIGFSTSPGMLGVLVFVPVVGGILLFGISIWVLVAGVMAVKQSLEFTTRRAIATCLVSCFACVLITVFSIIPLSSYLVDGTCIYSSSFDNQLNSIVSPYRFNIVIWEIATIPHEVSQLFGVSSKDIDNAADKVVDYFSHEGERDELLEDTIERILESQIIETLIQQDFYGFPPVNLKLGELPRLIVISPRDKIESMREIMLIRDISLEEIEDIEARVDELGFSSLVVDLGGLGGVYPSLVTNSASLRATINIAVEEWIHQYLAFKPLGFQYTLDLLGIARNYEIATMNETVAGIVSKEIGTIIYARYYRDKVESVTEDNADKPGFDFNQEMRAIRVEVDALLARGDIELAEQYMKQKRQYLVSQGYHIRKLNQAYFAWHGTYANEPTSVSPIGTELRELRDRSASLKDFLDIVSQMTSRQDLKDIIESIR
jgi:hypothetical protein